MTDTYRRGDTQMDYTRPMKALQIIQTIMLTCIIAIGGWIGATTVESSKAISEMKVELKSVSREYIRLDEELTRLWDAHYNLDRKVTVLEAKGK